MELFYKKWKQYLKEYKVPNDLYHGSPKKFSSFDSSRSNYRGLTYFTTNRNFAISFASGRGLDKGFIYTVKLPDDLQIFDVMEDLNIDKLRPILLELVQQKYKDSVTGVDFNPENKKITLNGESIDNPNNEQMVDYFIWRLQNKSWRVLEGEKILKFIEELGYDGLVTIEGNTQNIGIFPKSTSKINILSIDEIDVEPD